MADYTQSTSPVNSMEFRACVAVTGIAHGPTRDEWVAIRRTAKLPGGIDRTICGACGQREWSITLAGMCARCLGAWLDEQGES